jgi:hypothetical protein
LMARADTSCLGTQAEGIGVGIRHFFPRVWLGGKNDRPIDADVSSGALVGFGWRRQQ